MIQTFRINSNISRDDATIEQQDWYQEPQNQDWMCNLLPAKWTKPGDLVGFGVNQLNVNRQWKSWTYYERVIKGKMLKVRYYTPRCCVPVDNLHVNLLDTQLTASLSVLPNDVIHNPRLDAVLYDVADWRLTDSVHASVVSMISSCSL